MSLGLSILLSVCIICGTVIYLVTYKTKSREHIFKSKYQKEFRIEILGIVRDNFKEVKAIMEKVLPKNTKNTELLLAMVEKLANKALEVHMKKNQPFL